VATNLRSMGHISVVDMPRLLSAGMKVHRGSAQL
jgi:hypothetical protein